jgi:SNF2 family DNA or RNA helicase
LIHESRFREFRDSILKELDDNVLISHNYLKVAPVKPGNKIDSQPDAEQILYLSDFGQHISIVPVIRYDDVEVPVRTKRQIIATDEKGKEFIVKRDTMLEDAFTALLLKQHPDFTEQLNNPLQYFYLHKRRFLDEDWFLKAFEDWHLAGITILGFDEITENNQNPQKAKVSIQVISGLNWFNTDIDVRFGKKKASLKQLRHAIKTRSKFVRLDDGTTGIIPAEWLEKFSAWFAAGEVVEDTLRTPRVNFTSITDLYDEAFLSEEVKTELAAYSRRLAGHQDISNVVPSPSLLATLRPYQQHGLNWLNFLDDFNFGGCLADDMGLGKSLQIIAFILSQRTKRGMTTNMIVVPTSLIFNWLAEIEKFAPSLKVHTAYGSSRTKSTREFDQYEIILTSYGTLVSDLNYFKKFHFNYVFFDESQNMKNPQSQRNMAARALSSRSKIVITGTPVENNTFDLYGQLSIACPGLLGSLTHFRDVYSSPIDKFGVKKRTTELQKKVEPFILRRTKDQVAPELPEKIEMVVYCEMKPEQRQVYNAYEKEFREYISSKTDEDLSKSSMYVLKGITRLRQICDSPALVGEKAPGAASSKIETLITHIEDKSSGNKVLVFSQFVTMLDLIKAELQEKGISYSYLTGKTKNRETVINQFQDDPNIRVFLISLKAGGTGLNLTEANYVYIIDPWWNPAVENQAIDRCYRIGQKKNVVAVRLMCPDTVEEKIMKLQQLKKDRMDDLIKSDSSMLKSMSKTDLMGLFSSIKS